MRKRRNKSGAEQRNGRLYRVHEIKINGGKKACFYPFLSFPPRSRSFAITRRPALRILLYYLSPGWPLATPTIPPRNGRRGNSAPENMAKGFRAALKFMIARCILARRSIFLILILIFAPSNDFSECCGTKIITFFDDDIFETSDFSRKRQWFER